MSIVDNKYVRFFNQNTKIIIIIILIIIGGYLILKLFNNNIKKNNEENNQNNISNMINSPSNTKAVVSNQKVDSNIVESDQELIKSFMIFCNQGNVESAYALLTNDCKDVMYKDINGFKKYYIDSLFSEQRTYSIMTWITANDRITYKLSLQCDMLSTGNISDIPIEEYITVVNENNEKKLNINSFIGKEEVKKMNNDNDDITFKALSKEIYMDYEIYEFEIKNNTDKNILLDTLDSTESIYLVGKNGTQYTSYINELDAEYMYLNSECTKNIKVKFNKMYKPDLPIESIVFSNIVKDYNTYVSANDYAHIRDKIEINKKY